MAKRSKLLSALDAHQGRDFAKEKQKKLAKAAEKKKAGKQSTEDVEIEEEQKVYSFGFFQCRRGFY
jgi:rRNA-processing protein EBP2